jgi:hypothetical protein
MSNITVFNPTGNTVPDHVTVVPTGGVFVSEQGAITYCLCKGDVAYRIINAEAIHPDNWLEKALLQAMLVGNVWLAERLMRTTLLNGQLLDKSLKLHFYSRSWAEYLGLVPEYEKLQKRNANYKNKLFTEIRHNRKITGRNLVAAALFAKLQVSKLTGEYLIRAVDLVNGHTCSVSSGRKRSSPMKVYIHIRNTLTP